MTMPRNHKCLDCGKRTRGIRCRKCYAKIQPKPTVLTMLGRHHTLETIEKMKLSSYWRGKKLPLEVRKKLSIAHFGKKRGSKGWLENGYEYKYYTQSKNKATHRLVMESYLGRELRGEEIIHHINGDRLDNRLENLMLTTRSGHAKTHHLMRRFI